MVLFRVLNKLPVDTEKAEATAEQFYIQVVNTIKDRYRDKKLFDWVYHKGYYALTDVDLMYVAEDMDISTKDLLKKLKEFNFLYRTDSSMGYQTKIRFDSEHEGWAYCVARLELKEQVESTEEKSEQSGISE